MMIYMGPMDEPTPADFDTYARVSAWLRRSAHRSEVAARRCDLVIEGDGVFVKTKHGMSRIEDVSDLVDESWTL